VVVMVCVEPARDSNLRAMLQIWPATVGDGAVAVLGTRRQRGQDQDRRWPHLRNRPFFRAGRCCGRSGRTGSRCAGTDARRRWDTDGAVAVRVSQPARCQLMPSHSQVLAG
jgi:hypothetical protein